MGGLPVIAHTAPACDGLPLLFDATDRDTHKRARALCATCPALVACRTHLRAEMARIPGGKPTGTWAGRLFTDRGDRKRPSRAKGAAK